MLDVVALEAIHIERAAMSVDVARGAAPLEPEPAGVRSRPLRMAKDRRDPQRCLVTRRASLPPVTAVKRPSRTRVFEALDRSPLAFPAHECEVDAGVLRMAGRAALRLHGWGSVQATSALGEPGDLLVTVDTEAGHLFLAAASTSGMTLNAL
jgi:hypothetical protein